MDFFPTSLPRPQKTIHVCLSILACVPSIILGCSFGTGRNDSQLPALADSAGIVTEVNITVSETELSQKGESSTAAKNVVTVNGSFKLPGEKVAAVRPSIVTVKAIRIAANGKNTIVTSANAKTKTIGKEVSYSGHLELPKLRDKLRFVVSYGGKVIAEEVR